MPVKADEARIVGTMHDRRRKLSEDTKNYIAVEYAKGGISTRKLAEKYGVSRGTIQNILNPDRIERGKQLRAERGGSKIYYNKEKHTKAVAESRRHKAELMKQGKIEIED